MDDASSTSTKIKPFRRRIAVGAAAIALSALLPACGDSEGGAPVVNLYGFAAAAGFDKVIADCNQRAEGRYRIVGNLLPSDADGQREQFVRRLAAKDDSMDLLGLDVTWTAEFAEAGWIRELTPAQAAAATADIFEPPIKSATWKDKLYAIPKHTNVQLLWYRKSLVGDAPLTTWDDVINVSQRLKDEGKPYVIGFTAAQYEGLVVGFNTILSSLGGTIVNEDSTAVTIDDKTVEALRILKELAVGGLSSRSLSNSQEPEIFAQLQTGEAAFIINWPYVLSAMRSASPEVADDLGYAVLPEFVPGQPARATLGGMNFAVSSYSKHPGETFDAAMCLRDAKAQLAVAIDSGEPPVMKSIYSDPRFQEVYPMYPAMLAELETAVPRPVTPLYQNISTIISTTLSPPRDIDPQRTAQEMRDAIQDALDGKGILP